MAFQTRQALYAVLLLIIGLVLQKLLSAPSQSQLSTSGNMMNTTNATSDLPALSSREHALYNRLSEEMSYYHSHFRSAWTQLYSLTSPTSPSSPPTIISHGLRFCQQLNFHHDIEEASWFPVLGERMPGFAGDGFAKEQHREMHKGLDTLAGYLQECRTGLKEFKSDEVRGIMDSFGEVLWKHLDEEVEELKAENMRKFWSLEEMRRMPI